MTSAPVGIRCPDCAGVRTGVKRLAPRPVARGAIPVTIGLVALNVVIFAIQMIQASGQVGRGIGGDVAERGVLYGPNVADGEWWRLITSGFLHGGIAHLAMNMIALWLLGSIFEGYIGPLRFALVYVAAVVWGSAGALLLTPDAQTVGASGGVFGLMAGLLVLQWQRRLNLVSDLGLWLGLNLVITFTLPNISIGGHLGGILGGAAAAFALSNWGRGHMAARRLRPGVAAAVALIIVAGAATAIAAASRADGPPIRAEVERSAQG